MAFTLALTAEEIKKAQGTSFEPLPKGTYGASIYESVVKPSKKGNLMYANTYKITAGPTGIGRKIKGWHVIQGDGSFSSANLLKALELPYPDKDTPAGDFEFPDGEEIVGRELNLKLDVEPYDTLNADTGEEETRYNNVIKGTFIYDEDRHDDEIEEGEEAGAASGSFL